MKFLIKWIGFTFEGQENLVFLKKKRRNGFGWVEKDSATIFYSHDEAIKFTKKYIRNGSFGGNLKDRIRIDEIL